MLNSVAKYLWGSADEPEVENTGRTAMDDKESEQAIPEAFNVEEDDWVLVGALGSDKENRKWSHPSLHHPSQTPHHNHHHHHHHHLLLPQGSPDSLSQAVDSELDDAASLAHQLSEPCASPLQDCGLQNLDLDSNYSSDTESGRESGLRPSSPESVFSTCSGRSHATYKPRGRTSEPWVMTPPPCFTASKAGELTPIASSPLENLLIEHPSMSVYLSVPSSSLPPSHPFLSTLADGAESQEEVLSSGEHVMSGGAREDVHQEAENAVQQRRPSPAAIHPNHASRLELMKNAERAQHLRIVENQKNNSNQKCKRQNKVRLINSESKNSNRRNKGMRPSGCKASRSTQRHQKM